MTMTGNPTIALVGPGAIGTTVAAALHEVGESSVDFPYSTFLPDVRADRARLHENVERERCSQGFILRK